MVGGGVTTHTIGCEVGRERVCSVLCQLLLKFAAQCGQTGDNPSHYCNRRACTHACDVGTGCKYWIGDVKYILVWYILVWCVIP